MLGVQHVLSWREWLLRLFVPPPVSRPKSPKIRPRQEKVARPPRVLPAVRYTVAALAHGIVLPAWLQMRWQTLTAALTAHPTIEYWLIRFAPAQAVPLLKNGLVWVHRLEDEALILAMLMALGVLILVASTPLTVPGQAVFALLIVVAGGYLGRMRATFSPAALSLLAMLATLRYLWWRIDRTLILETDADFAASVLLVAAELFLIGVLFARFYRALLGKKRHHAREPFVFAMMVVLLAPNLYLLFGIRIYQAPPLDVMLYLLPGLLLALLALACLDRVRRGWRKWLHSRCAQLEVPFPLVFAALNLAGLLAGIARAVTMPETADTLLYAGWACLNILMLRAGGRLRPAVLPQHGSGV